MANNTVLVKIGMLGDTQVGKTSLMVKYVEGKFDEDYIMTLGVNFLEKQINIQGNEIQLMIWDLGGQKEFMSMIDLVCKDALALFFMFDLSRKATLHSIKEWYLQSRKHNKNAQPFLIGTKFDKFLELPEEEQNEITETARKYSEKMKAPLIYSSAQAGINIKKLFKLVLAKVFDLPVQLDQITGAGEPLLEWQEE